MRRPGVRSPSAPPIESNTYGEALLAVFDFPRRNAEARVRFPFAPPIRIKYLWRVAFSLLFVSVAQCGGPRSFLFCSTSRIKHSRRSRPRPPWGGDNPQRLLGATDCRQPG